MHDEKMLVDEEIIASEKRAQRLKEINEELQLGNNSEMADILARINADNNKF